MVSISDLTATFQKDFHLSDRIDLLSKTAKNYRFAEQNSI